jgi:LysR family transcriptional regulator of beta-lactamase
MSRAQLPLNALRAFEASARHLSFTRAAIELCVTQAAVSHQVKGLEQRLGASLFRRLPRGLALTDEGLALLPTVRDSFDRMGDVLERFSAGRVMEVLSVGVVGTFAVGWLLPRLPSFREAHPFVDLRLFTNNNRIDIAGEGLDCAVRFGDGAWHGTQAVAAVRGSDDPAVRAGRGRAPEVARGPDRRGAAAQLSRRRLARLVRRRRISPPPIRGPVFDSSWVMVEAAMQGVGVALAPSMMFARDLEQGRLVRPFALEVGVGDVLADLAEVARGDAGPGGVPGLAGDGILSKKIREPDRVFGACAG